MSDNATTPRRRAARTRRGRSPVAPPTLYQLPPDTLACLCELIAKHNPYTTGRVEDMDIHLHPPAPDDPDNDNCSRVEWQQDGGYPGDWSFKGQPQKINKVLRIKYRAAVRSKDQYGNQDPTKPVLYWMTAYLLVGFEDGGN